MKGTKAELEAITRMMGDAIADEIGDDSMCFLLMIFDPTCDWLSYSAKVDREDGFTAILELMLKLDREKTVKAIRRNGLMNLYGSEGAVQ